MKTESQNQAGERTQMTVTIVDGGKGSAEPMWSGVPVFSGTPEEIIEEAELYARRNASQTDLVTIRVFDGDICILQSTITIREDEDDSLEMIVEQNDADAERDYQDAKDSDDN